MASVISAVMDQDFPVGSGVKITAELGHFDVESVCMAAVNIIAKKTVLESGGWASPGVGRALCRHPEEEDGQRVWAPPPVPN